MGTMGRLPYVRGGLDNLTYANGMKIWEVISGSSEGQINYAATFQYDSPVYIGFWGGSTLRLAFKTRTYFLDAIVGACAYLNTTSKSRAHYQLHSESNGWYYVSLGSIAASRYNLSFVPYSSLDEFLGQEVSGYNIVYEGINCNLTGPSHVSYGDNVNISVVTNNGMGILNPTQGNSITVYNSDGYIDYQFRDNIISFKAPDDSY